MTWTIEWIEHALRNHVELAIFLVLSLGHLIGRLRIGPLKLNPVIGVLLAGVVVGQARIEVPGVVEWMFFVLFLFSVGYKTGPQFFRGFGWNALPQVVLAALLGVTALATTYAVSRVLGFGAGTAAGLLAGGLTASPAVGTASDAISRLAVDEDLRRALSADVTVAFAVTYFVGLFAAILVLVRIGPWLMQVDLRSECKQLEKQLGLLPAEEGVVSAHRPFVTRSYKLAENFNEKTVAELERAFAPDRVFVERVRTAHGMIDAAPSTRLRAGDIIVLSGRSRVLASRNNPLHLFEVDDPSLSDIPVVAVDHVLRRKDLIHRTLAEIVETLGGEAATRGVFVRKILRAGDEVPLGGNVRLERGDVLTLVGSTRNIDLVAAQLGPVERPSVATDIVVLGMAIAIGGLIGLPALHVAGLDFGLSLPVGVLLGGLVAGWLQSVRPLFGRIPDATIWLLDSLGLTAFLATIGLSAGPSFVHGIRTSGLVLLVSGFLVCAVPMIVTILAGRFLFRVHPGILLGICAGGGTSPVGLAAVQQSADSQVPTLGYGVSFAVGNVILALWGSVVVTLMHSHLK